VLPEERRGRHDEVEGVAAAGRRVHEGGEGGGDRGQGGARVPAADAGEEDEPGHVVGVRAARIARVIRRIRLYNPDRGSEDKRSEPGGAKAPPGESFCGGNQGRPPATKGLFGAPLV